MMTDIQLRIQHALEQLGQQHHIRILFAIESGSRAWGFPSADSDYDVRIVYCHPPEWYLSIFEQRDVIEQPITDELDISGWELRKALRLLHNNNAVIHEWLHSPIIYRHEATAHQSLQQLANRIFNARPVFHHYLAMSAKKLDVTDDTALNAKRFLYGFRTLLCCLWIEKYHTAPPMLFQTLLQDLLLDEATIRDEIEQLVADKAQGAEADAITQPEQALQYARQQLARLRQANIPVTNQRETACFDQCFKQLLRRT